MPAAAFFEDWARASSTLTTARLGRVLHVGAIAFALGALASIYLRGLAFEYRAGWESTFLGADAVRAVLGAVLGPASALTGIALPDTAGYAALRFSAGPGVPAAPWLHLFAVTVALAVLVPRPPQKEAAELAAWRAHLARHAIVRGVLALDAFARCWVQEVALLAAVDGELVTTSGLAGRVRDLAVTLGFARDGTATPKQAAMQPLAARLTAPLTAAARAVLARLYPGEPSLTRVDRE